MIDIAVIGAGNRARKYLQCLPPGVRVRSVIEPDPLRLSIASRMCGVPERDCFSSSDEFFSHLPAVDAAIIAAPDRLHVPLALQAVSVGLPVLLEKPVSQSEAEYRSLMDAASAAGVSVGVCLEMRCHPFFRRLGELARSGIIGDIQSIEHVEHVGPDRMAHSFVRGLWSRKADSGPIFLSKCCHDADFLLSVTGGKVVSVRSWGSLSKFVHNPSAPARCIDCSREDCPYSAVKLYRDRGAWTECFDVPDGSTLSDVVEAELLAGKYGRCVYRCDNDVFDEQTVEAVLDNGITLKMSMEGTSMQEGRVTRIQGARGAVFAGDGIIRVTDCEGRTVLEEDYSELVTQPFHSGADRTLMAEFFAAVKEGREPESSLSAALEGHRLCWLADCAAGA